MNREDYIFRRIREDEVEDVRVLIHERIDWMNEMGLHQWNETHYDERFPLSYFQSEQRAGHVYALFMKEDGRNGKENSNAGENGREAWDSKDGVDGGDSRDSGDTGDAWKDRDARDSKDIVDSGEPRDSKDVRDGRKSWGGWNSGDTVDAWKDGDARDGKDGVDGGDSRDSGDNGDAWKDGDARDSKVIVDIRESWGGWNSGDTVDAWKDRDARDSRDGVDGRERMVCAGVMLEEDFRWPDNTPALYLHNLAASTRHKGTGGLFVEFAEEEVKRQGLRYLRLDSAVGNEKLTVFYESRGYLPKGYCQHGLYHGILREKEL